MYSTVTYSTYACHNNTLKYCAAALFGHDTIKYNTEVVRLLAAYGQTKKEDVDNWSTDNQLLYCAPHYPLTS